MPVWQGCKYTSASWPRSDHNSGVENKMPLRLFAFIFPSLYSSLCKHLLIDRNLSELVALLTCASHSSLELFACRGDGDWCNHCSGRSLFTQRKKTKTTHTNIEPMAFWAASSSLVWEEKPLNLAAISDQGLFLGFTVKKGTFMVWRSHRLSVSLWNSSLSNTSHL